MNLGIIIYILGYVLKIEAALLCIPLLVALIYGESAWTAFLIAALVAFAVGTVLNRKPSDMVFYLKEGCITTAMAWLLLSLVGCLPFVLSGSIPSFTDALFETISGFTTTGSSILTDVEALPVSCLFWRSFTHWVGGMGVLVFLLAIIPLSGGSHMNLMRAESPGPSVGKLVPKLRATARILYVIYFVMTVVLCVLLMAGGMPFLESLMISFGTAGTGGFGVRNASCGDYSPYIQWVVAIFMMLFGVNFNAYYLILLKKFKDAFNMEELRAYFLMILSAVVLIMISVYDHTLTFADTLRHVFFQVSSLTTSTGFSSMDYDVWPDAAKGILILSMFIGACAGSTGGGIKVSRMVIAVKAAVREIGYYLHPKSVKKVKMDGRTVDQAMIDSVNVYIVVFAMVFIVSFVLISFNGFDLVTTFSAVLTTLNNMGPGFNLVGPACNFSGMSVFSKYVLMFDMLAGRLELFPMLLLFHPILWKEAAKREQRKWLRKKEKQ